MLFKVFEKSFNHNRDHNTERKREKLFLYDGGITMLHNEKLLMNCVKGVFHIRSETVCKIVGQE